jgi:5-histidylcysteine sulfoxide synthase/putative 4-mercaptohistidine N1-methyltranferase
MNINQYNEVSEPKSPTLTGNCINSKRAELKRYFKATWQRYDSLFSLINNDEVYYQRPEPLRHPLIFYFGHTACFYINKLILGKYIDERINPRIEAICAVGVDEMSWDDLNSAHYDWPTVDEIRVYRQQVFNVVDRIIDTMSLVLPIKQNSLAWIILMGCEHERIHIETSSVIMRMLPLAVLTSNEQWPTCLQTDSPPTNVLVPVKGSVINFGKPTSDDSFGWDNEYGNASVSLNDFHAAKYLVSNEEFLGFVKDGGYQNKLFWTQEGQQWLAFTEAKMPRFWLMQSGEYWQRNLLNEMPLPLDWPVEVNYLEAKAFCNWKNSLTDEGLTDNDLTNKENQGHYRLPSEGEWIALRGQVEGDLLSWQQAPGNINSEYFASSCPINKFSQGDFYDIVGNVWQWTESAIDGFNGFTIHPLYDDFSTPTFDGKHNLIKGGSWISTGNEAMQNSRYAFRRHFFQHAGFRYVVSKSESIPNLADNHYETDTQVCRQLENHFEQLNSLSSSLSDKEQQPINELNQATNEQHLANNYLEKLADTIIRVIDKYNVKPMSKCLDLGCNVGGLSFILAKYFTTVDAVDFSARYIQYGVKLQQGESIRYVMPREGELIDFKEFTLATELYAESKKIHFSQGDISNLKNIFAGYDVIVAQNVLEQSYDPALFLAHVHNRLNAEGLLVIISDYQFTEKITEKTKWLGGQKINGENVTGFEALTTLLDKNLTLINEQELTQIIKTDTRHFSVINSHLTIWQLNDNNS